MLHAVAGWGQWLQSTDVAAFRLINIAGARTFLDPVMAGFTQIGLGHVQLLLLALVYVLGGPAARRTVLFCVIAFAVSGIAAQVIKHAVGRPRPASVMPDVRIVLEKLRWNSFPSGHTATSWAIAVVAGARHRRWVAPLLLCAALVGYSRVYIGAHFPGDVLGGILLGILIGLTCLYADRRQQARKLKSRAKPEPLELVNQ